MLRQVSTGATVLDVGDSPAADSEGALAHATLCPARTSTIAKDKRLIRMSHSLRDTLVSNAVTPNHSIRVIYFIGERAVSCRRKVC